MKKWYYNAEAHFFLGFLYLTDEEHEANPMPTAGPFNTFSEAKIDAINRFKIDIAYAKDAIAEIRAIRRPRR